jgi:hypothetical protein
VRPNGRFSIIDAPFLSALVLGVPSWSRRSSPTLQRRGTPVCRSQDVHGCKAFGVVAERWDVYHGRSIAHYSTENKYLREDDPPLTPPGCRASH